ncbi:hypothetical protein [Haloferula sp.]|uniref:hypothetical protein n=1 Tax=Haloferula sp. TaxID=2497595 RepID=UPI003C7617E6
MDFLKEALKHDPSRSTEEQLATWKIELEKLRSREIDQNLRIVELDYEKSKLELKLAALLRLLVENGTIDADRFTAMMTVIDAEDGRLDGRVTPEDPGRSPFVAS